MGQGLVAGPTQGFGPLLGDSIESTPWSAGPADVATKAILSETNAATEASGEIVTLTGVTSTAAFTAAEYASGVGEVKLAYDAISYTGALVGCKLGFF